MRTSNRAKILINRILADIASRRVVAFIASNRLLAEIKIGYFTLARILSNFAQFSDSLFKSFGKSISDQATASEQFQRQVEYRRIYENESAAVESISKDVGLRVGDDTDQDYVEDGYFFEDYVTGPSTEIMDVQDALTLLTGKGLSETTNASETFSKTAIYSRTFTDSAYATDDLNGAAVPGDDQTIHFFKVKNDSGFVAESAVLDLSKAESDAADVAESNIIDFGKYKADQAQAGEQAEKQVGKELSNTGEAAEAAILSFSTSRSDGTSASETLVKSAEKIRSDAAECADSGSLISQSYVDNNDYFAEDYVGASRTF